jgi:hypothetical protein
MHFHNEQKNLKAFCSLLDYVIGKPEGVMCFMEKKNLEKLPLLSSPNLFVQNNQKEKGCMLSFAKKEAPDEDQ